MAYWRWEPRARRFRLTAEGAAATGQQAGTFVGQNTMLDLRDRFIASQKQRVNALASNLANGDITLGRWVLDMRQEIKTNFIDQYLLAHGGRNNMTQADWGRIGQMVRQQYDYLDSFAGDIARGKYSEAQIAARARMYVESSSQAYSRGETAARGMPDLPQNPGDGRTQCLSNCKCTWKIREFDDRWECTWELNPAEHCPDCIRNAERWAPLTIQKVQATTRSAVLRHLEGVTT